ncbi:transposase [Nocardia sp. NPDC059246]|uniref:transposase n=1 Tax=unclassified Nocardia TaxID=2637762 RepID=UPI0036800395
MSATPASCRIDGFRSRRTQLGRGGDRCAEAGIPVNRCSQGVLTKPRLAEAMIASALDAGAAAGWVAADAAYGRDGRFRGFCEARRLSYVLEVPVRQTVADLDGRRRGHAGAGPIGDLKAYSHAGAR